MTELSTLVEAECTDERIVFRQHGFARAVLRHVWRDYPLTRPDLLTWLAALPTDEAVPPARRDSLVQTFTELAAEYGEAGRITKAARGWAEADLPDLAFIALSQSCLDRQVGGRVREKLYHWSRQARTPQTLKLTIARVCEPLGQTYPSIALTRLKHLATYGNRQVLEQVMEAAAGLVRTGRRREVFAAALAWCTDNPFENLSAAARERRIRAGARLFVTVAGRPAASGVPAMLDGEGAVDPMDCVPTWCAALRTYAAVPEQPDPVLGETLRHWLNAALHHPHLRDGITRCLVRAARTTAPPSPGNRAWPPRPNPTAARTVRALVRQWAALDIADQARRSVKEGVVVPLTDPWWWRLCKIAYVRLRTLLAQRREPG